MSILAIACLTAFLINLFCAMHIYALHRNDPLNRCYLWLSITMTGWTFLEFVVQTCPSPEAALPVMRAKALFWAPLGWAYLRFVHLYINRPYVWLSRALLAVALASIPVSLLTGLVHRHALRESWGFTSEAGSLYLPIGIYNLLGPALYGLLLFYRRYRSTLDDQERLHLKTLLRGTALMGTVAFLLDLFPKLVAHFTPLPVLPHFVPLTTTLFMVPVYRMLRHYNFLHIRMEETSPHLFVNMSEGVILIDRADRIAYANPSACRILNVAEGSFASVSGSAFLANLGVERPHEEVHRVSRQDDRYLGVSVCPYHKDGIYLGKLVLLNDVTERRRAQEELAQLLQQRTQERDGALDQQQLARQEARSRAALIESLIDNLPFPLCVFTPEGNYSLQNVRCRDMWGCMLSHSVTDLPEQTPLRRSWERNRDEVLAGKSVENEWTHRDADGADQWSHVLLAPVRDEGRITGVLAVSMDVSARKQLEEQLRHVQKMEAASRLAGGIAHDFNNILSVMLGHTEICLECVAPEHPARCHVEAIRSSGKRGAELTRQLLAFSRKQPIEVKPVDLNQRIREMESIMQRLLPKPIQLQTRLSIGLPPVMADAGQIDQVLMNLLVNARDALPQGGQILAATRLARGEELRDNGVDPARDTYAVFSVSDNGIGMDAETMRHIFEPFFTTKDGESGTGLGLATTYGIVRQHEGHILVASEKGKGTTFTIYLPASATPRSPAAVGVNESGKESADTGPRHILLAEDEPEIRAFTGLALGKLGYKVHEASTPLEALRFAENPDNRIDLLISDIIMPEVIGTELYRKLSLLRPGLDVLYITGYADMMADNPALQGKHVLHKPFTLGELQTAVASLLR